MRETETQTLPAKRKSTQANGKTLAQPLAKRPYTLAHIVDMKLQGMTQQEIGDYYGVSRQAIQQKIKGIWEKMDKDKLEAYRANRVALLETSEVEILSWMGKKDKLEKASGNNLAYMFTQVHQARRLEAGESTTNIALHSIIEKIERDEQKKRGTPQDVVDGTLEA